MDRLRRGRLGFDVGDEAAVVAPDGMNDWVLEAESRRR